MAYQLPSERVSLDLDGPIVEVQRLASLGIWAVAMNEMSAVMKAKGRAAQVTALSALYERFVAEALPSWDILDHRGPVPATVSGALRLPFELGVLIVAGWLETFDQEEAAEPASAVDKLIAPGPARDELNRRLRMSRKAA